LHHLDSSKVSALASLDLSTAIDTVHHAIMSERFESWFQVSSLIITGLSHVSLPEMSLHYRINADPGLYRSTNLCSLIIFPAANPSSEYFMY